MSDVSDFLDKLYSLSEKYKMDEINEYIENKFDFFKNIGRYEYIDSILYGIDLNKIKIGVAKILYEKVYDFQSKIVMYKAFEENIKEYFGKDVI